jgi:hypothetical protein
MNTKRFWWGALFGAALISIGSELIVIPALHRLERERDTLVAGTDSLIALVQARTKQVEDLSTALTAAAGLIDQCNALRTADARQRTLDAQRAASRIWRLAAKLYHQERANVSRPFQDKRQQLGANGQRQ